uniref:Golgi transport 1A n=1 Tax=Equus caballus TaxID=9796 RepID=A0A9L0SP41_HORSE
MISITEWQKIGVGTTGFGVFFVLFGILLYFDAVLLAFGNLLFLVGLSLIIGLRKMLAFFFQRHKLKGTSFFLGGVVIVLLRWPLLGMCLETYGFFNLFNPENTLIRLNDLDLTDIRECSFQKLNFLTMLCHPFIQHSNMALLKQSFIQSNI